MRRILVTGGCGFIGANFVRLEREAYPDLEITNLDALTYAGNPDNLAGLESEPRYRFVRGDVADRALVLKLVAEGDFDAIVHFAAESHVDRSIDDATPFLRTNVVGTQCLLDAARRRHAEVRPGLDRRGLRHAQARRTPLLRGDPAGPQQPLRRQQGGRRPARPRRAPHARDEHRHHPLLEQLRALPVPREADPPVRHQRPGRHPPARLRRRPAGPRLDPRRRPLPGGRRRAPTRAARRDLQLRRPERAVQHRRHPRRAQADRQARVADPARHRPPRPRSPLRRRLLEGRGRAGLARPPPSKTAWPRLSTGIALMHGGSSASARGPIATREEERFHHRAHREHREKDREERKRDFTTEHTESTERKTEKRGREISPQSTQRAQRERQRREEERFHHRAHREHREKDREERKRDFTTEHTERKTEKRDEKSGKR